MSKLESDSIKTRYTDELEVVNYLVGNTVYNDIVSFEVTKYPVVKQTGHGSDILSIDFDVIDQGVVVALDEYGMFIEFDSYEGIGDDIHKIHNKHYIWYQPVL